MKKITIEVTDKMYVKLLVMAEQYKQATEEHYSVRDVAEQIIFNKVNGIEGK